MGDVEVDGPVESIAAGDHATCVLLEDGSVWCWGRGYLRLANADTGFAPFDPEHYGVSPETTQPRRVDVGGRATRLAVGAEHACVVLDAGNVRCWGSGANGRLGYAGTESVGDDETVASVGDVDVGGPVRQIAAGASQTCAVLEGGQVRCWGFGGDGRLGYGNTRDVGDDETPASAGDVDVGGAVRSVHMQGALVCALLEYGSVRCWGPGFLTVAAAVAPSEAGDTGLDAGNAGVVDASPAISDASAGGSIALEPCRAVDSVVAHCRGYTGALGYGSVGAIGDDEAPAVAGDVPLGESSVELAVGAEHACALLETGGVRCWGPGGRELLGRTSDEPIGDDEPPSATGFVDVAGPSHASTLPRAALQIAAGWSHVCALLDTAAVRCWGDGSNGQLGYGSRENIGDDEAAGARGDVEVRGIVREIATGHYHTCAVLDSGAVRCWGSGSSGALGYGNVRDIGAAERPASAGFVDLGGAVRQLSLGRDHSCAILASGAVRCWGANQVGQLGYPGRDAIGDDESIRGASDVDIGGTVRRIAAGASHTCALIETGQVRCCGANDRGQLGYGHTENIGDDETPASAGDVELGGRVRLIEAGPDSTCALLESGSVRCWGAADMLGYGRSDDIGDDETPASAGDLELGGRAEQISVGNFHACALLEGGRARCWGRDDFGIASETPSSVPALENSGPLIALSAGSGYVCALTAAGTVRCWGLASTLGQLGYGDDGAPRGMDAPQLGDVPLF